MSSATIHHKRPGERAKAKTSDDAVAKPFAVWRATTTTTLCSKSDT